MPTIDLTRHPPKHKARRKPLSQLMNTHRALWAHFLRYLHHMSRGDHFLTLALECEARSTEWRRLAGVVTILADKPRDMEGVISWGIFYNPGHKTYDMRHRTRSKNSNQRKQEVCIVGDNRSTTVVQLDEAHHTFRPRIQLPSAIPPLAL